MVQYACDNGDGDSATTMPGLRDGYPAGDCYDSTNDNNNPASCEGSTCPGCVSSTHWISRTFKSANQKKTQGTNTIPNPIDTGSTNLGGMTKSVRDAFYDARSNTASATRSNGVDYGIEYGMHENNRWYEKCTYTIRNKGLFVADQKLNKNDARATRQNPNGNRRGLECPEERDYYPYWRPTPWVDLAILTSDISYCDYFQEKSQNVNPTYECACTFLDADNINTARQSATTENKLCPITQAECEAGGYQWVMTAAKTGKAPDCVYHPFQRDNHLGNADPVDPETGLPVTPSADSQPTAATYTLRIPDEMQGQCVVRLRYNMSTDDYPSHKYAEQSGTVGIGLQSLENCPWTTGQTDCANGAADGGDPDCALGTSTASEFACADKLTEIAVPLYNRPYVNLFNETAADGGFTLGLAINTHQTGRTFQDRSYVFNVESAPGSTDGKRILNLGLRGRRGNIVQSYPAVEYDFAPTLTYINQGDYLHIQLHGSDFNDNRNANNGEGWEFSDRANIVQQYQNDRGTNYPAHHSDITFFSSTTEAKKWAWVGQSPSSCDPNVNNDNNQNAYKNCGKLNMAPNRFPQNPQEGLMQMNQPVGTYAYMSTRNNNFSNRSQKSQIVVQDEESDDGALSTGAQLAIGFSAAFVAGFGAMGVAYYMKKNGMGCFGNGGRPNKKTFTEI